MNGETFEAYRHSGKFGIHGPILALGFAVVAGFPLGYMYAYAIKWIPFIYLNFLATLGYGFLFGFGSGWLLKFGKVRNPAVASLTALLAGLLALYFAWNGHIHAVIEGAPAFCWPNQLLYAIRVLYEHGSWGLRGGDNLTGIPLAIVWVVEAGMIVGLATLAAIGMVAHTPFCETSQCWLDQEKKIDTLDVFTDPAQLAAFQAGDLSPLTQARPKPPRASHWTRLLLKHSPNCDHFYTVRLQFVSREIDKDGKLKDTTKDLTKDLMLPRSMFELISKFEKFKETQPGIAPESPTVAGASEE